MQVMEYLKCCIPNHQSLERCSDWLGFSLMKMVHFVHDIKWKVRYGVLHNGDVGWWSVYGRVRGGEGRDDRHTDADREIKVGWNGVGNCGNNRQSEERGDERNKGRWRVVMMEVTLVRTRKHWIYSTMLNERLVGSKVFVTTINMQFKYKWTW